MAEGKTGSSAAAEDTFGCREYHLSVAMARRGRSARAGHTAGPSKNAMAHCPHAALLGGAQCVGATPASPLKKRKYTFCSQFREHCGADAEAYANCGEAMTALDGGGAGDTSGDTFECRAYHLGAALKSRRARSESASVETAAFSSSSTSPLSDPSSVEAAASVSPLSSLPVSSASSASSFVSSLSSAAARVRREGHASAAGRCTKIEWGYSLGYPTDVACIENTGSKAFDNGGLNVLLNPGGHTKKCMLYAPCKKAWVLLGKPAKTGGMYSIDYYLGPDLHKVAIAQIEKGATAGTLVKDIPVKLTGYTDGATKAVTPHGGQTEAVPVLYKECPPRPTTTAKATTTAEATTPAKATTTKAPTSTAEDFSSFSGFCKGYSHHCESADPSKRKGVSYVARFIASTPHTRHGALFPLKLLLCSHDCGCLHDASTHQRSHWPWSVVAITTTLAKPTTKLGTATPS